VVYAHSTYLTPVKLSSKPDKRKNPRGWFESYGVLVAGQQIGQALIKGSGKTVPVYRELQVTAP